MRIAMVSEHASPLAVLGGVDAGGQNVHVAALSGELVRRGIEVTVYTRRDDPTLPRRVTMNPGVTVEHVAAGPPRRLPKDELLPFMDDFATDLVESWRRWMPDVVHSHFWMSGKASIAAASYVDVPVVHTFHALGVVKRRHQRSKDTSPRGRLAEERRIIRDADWIISTCTDEVFELRRLGADVARVSVVPCGVNLRNFQPRGRAERRRPGMRRLVVVSRLVERKGIGDVVAALPELPDTELVIAGGADIGELWNDREALRLLALAEELGVSHRVVFRGRLERGDVPALMRSADAVVCTPWYEPFGIVPLEAMACGVPVIATAVGGMIDTVVDGLTGLHVPPKSPGAIAAAARRLFADPSFGKRLGAQGAARARDRYGWGRVADATLQVYRQLAATDARRLGEVSPP